MGLKIKLKGVLYRTIKNLANTKGYTFTKNYDQVIDRDEKFMEIYNKYKEYTMTTKERMYALYKSIKYIIDSKIPGDFVECGVWRGGSAMIIAHTLLELNVKNRKIHLYDTFEGMSKPTEKDYIVANKKARAIDIWKKKQKKGFNQWAYSSLDEVKKNMYSMGYPKNNLIFIKGKVEETIPKSIPKKIALLRLDTDFYESTKHELINLFPLLEKKGILIIDDYGCWAGSKIATDEYFSDKPILFNRIDSSAIICIKTN